MRHFETLLLTVVGLAIVAALAWLTTRALEPFFGAEPVAATPTARARAIPAIVATAPPPRPTSTTVPKRPTSTARPTRAPEREPSRTPAPARVRPEPSAAPGPSSPVRWSAPRGYRVESAAKLHEEPDAASHVIARLRPGTIVRVVAERDGWLRVESSLGRRAGWLTARAARPVGAAPDEAPE